MKASLEFASRNMKLFSSVVRFVNTPYQLLRVCPNLTGAVAIVERVAGTFFKQSCVVARGSKYVKWEASWVVFALAFHTVAPSLKVSDPRCWVDVPVVKRD
jgi:hypothetical protein